MATIVDSLSAATVEMRAAATALQNVEALYRQMVLEKTNAADQALVKFRQASTTAYFVDPSGLLGGDDTNDGLSNLKPVRTLEKALDLIDLRGASIFGTDVFLLSDGAVVTRLRGGYSPISIQGVAWGGGLLGAPYRYVSRSLTFLGEAVNSPVPGFGRAVASLVMYAQSIRFQSIDIKIPDAPADLDHRAIIYMVNGGTVVVGASTISASTPGTPARLFAANAPTSFFITGTVGADAPGKLFLGIPAGVNPNTSFNYRTNLTSG